MGRMRIAWLFVVAGCSAPGVPTGGTSPASQGLVVHEWGTFTSVVASTGERLVGLHHEEEPLPAFVHGRAAVDTGHKQMESTPVGVTQKLETPVLYFYAPSPQAVEVRVAFPQGIVSQWFPDAADFAPALGTATSIAGGAMTWRAQLQPGLDGFPPVAPDDIWAPSRHVAATPLAIGAEHEQFIFYRGLGAFDVPLAVTARNDGTFSVENRSSDPIAALFLLRLHFDGGAIVPLGALGAGQSLANVVPPVDGKERNVDQYVADASTQIAAALVATGLTADEAQAMVDTWSKSYFRSEGLRLLYMVPRTWTDRLLPIAIAPEPTALVRTLVGRVEMLTPIDEQEVLDLVRSAALSAMPATTFAPQLGRFAEPKLRRALEMLDDPTAKSYCAGLIDQIAVMP
jgi:hypothetical protein